MIVDIERVKKHNAECKDYTQKAAKMQAERDFIEAEITKGCAELSQELGIQITAANVEEILNQNAAKINADVAAGEEILARIKLEEQGITEGSTVTMAPVQEQQTFTQAVPVQMQAAPVQMQAAPVQMQEQVVLEQPLPVSQQVQTQVPLAAMPVMQFGNVGVPQQPAATAPVAVPENIQAVNGELPPLFMHNNNGVVGI